MKNFIVVSVVAVLSACAPGAARFEETSAVPEELSSLQTELGTPPSQWFDSGSLHHGEVREVDLNSQAQRRIFTFYVTGNSADAWVSVRASAPVKLAVFGPVSPAGTRATLGTQGYGTPLSQPTVSFKVAKTGQYRVVVAPFQTGHDIHVSLDFACAEGACHGQEAIVAPQSGAMLTGRALEVKLNPSLCNKSVEVWTSKPPLQLGRHKLAVVTPLQCVAKFTLPASVQEGDDITLTVPGIESGVRVRLWTATGGGAQLQAVTGGDQIQFHVSGVAPFFEGLVNLRLYNHTRNQLLASTDLNTLKPGQLTMGFATFDASLEVPFDRLPVAGDLLSVGYEDMSPAYQRLACFTVCAATAGCDYAPAVCP